MRLGHQSCKTCMAVLRSEVPWTKGESRTAYCWNVVDGDTLDVLVAEGNELIWYRIRLRGVDAPEKNQDYGSQSADCLSKLALAQYVSLLSYGGDPYGRVVADVQVSSTNVQIELLKEGLAWHHDYYDKRVELKAAMDEARTKKRGLWKDANATPPWEHRKTGDVGTKHQSAAPVESAMEPWVKASLFLFILVILCIILAID
eukprot:TRINITY_DN5312_c0_g2_i3.p1 TRINITY_DN5312_c0_g2~~TRINITY_DN5312_c0_g2_i3.p1  ORF type:complete len:202 (-),score=34.08 TRINITY_DN5312_c0_g2_i3:126-731(-)